jgi:uncharacterized protein (DUF885 family)
MRHCTPALYSLTPATLAQPRGWPLALLVAAAAWASGHAAWAQAPASAASAPAAPSRPAQAASFDTWAESFAADWVRLSPERATFSQYFSGPEQAALERQLTPQTQAQRQRVRLLARDGLARVATFEAVMPLTPLQRTQAAVIRWEMQRALDSAPYEDHGFVFNQLGGPQVRYVSFLSEMQPLRRPADLEAFNARLALLEQRVDEALERARAAAARGLLPPRFVVERARTQVQEFLAPAAADNVLVQALARRSQRIDGLAPEERQRAIDTATATVDSRVRPAWQRILAFLNEIEPRTTADAGLWRLPDGDKAYAQALANFTTTTMSAEQIHAVGLREVARIEAEMDRVLQRMGRKDGSVKERMDTLFAELEPPADPDPRPQILDRYRAAVADNIQRAAGLFNLLPKAPVEVRRQPALTERTAAANYMTPAPDGSMPGIFWLPLPGPLGRDVVRMRSLAVHEAVPGHHYQLALQQELGSLPKWQQRRIFGGGSAITEGWALYAERLAIDQGWYAGDDIGLLGALDAQLFRARRLVVDTGLHAKRWTREQAIAYGIIPQEVERYVSNPGQACAYMIGMLRIIELREQASATLGTRFDLRAFHDVVLTAGSVPLDVLGDVVQRWVAQTKAKAA